jgi:H+/Cl- antiporter ClcA
VAHKPKRIRYWYPLLLIAEAAGSLVFIAVAMVALTEQRVQETSYSSSKFLLQVRWTWLAAYVLPLVALAVLLAWTAARALRHARNSSRAPAWNSTSELGVLLAQPFLLLAGIAAVSSYVAAPSDPNPVGYVPGAVASAFAVGLLVGICIIVARLVPEKSLRPSWRLWVLGIAAACLTALMPWLAVDAAGVGFGTPSGPWWYPAAGGGVYAWPSNFAAGFTNLVAVPTGQALPVSLDCLSAAECYVYGVTFPSTSRGPTYDGITHVGGSDWQGVRAIETGAPARIERLLAELV